MMPNPRRHSHTSNNQTSTNFSQHNNSSSNNNNNLSTTTSLINFFKKPLAVPFILSALLFLTWVSLRLQHSSSHIQNRKFGKNSEQWSKENDLKANLVRFNTGSERIMKDTRGWLLDPVKLALQYGLKGGAVSCAFAHIGEIRPGGLRGNHRHHTTNETFVLWGAQTRFRLENSEMDEGYAEVSFGPDNIVVAASPSGTAHALINADSGRSTFFLGCQDGSSSATDFKVWKDL